MLTPTYASLCLRLHFFRSGQLGSVHVEHSLVEGGDAVGRHALGDEPRPRLVRPWLHQYARRDVVQVRQGHDVRRRPPAVVHLREPEPRPVRHQQRPVVRRDLVRVLTAIGAGLSCRPPRELGWHPSLPVLDYLHHFRDRGAGHLAREGRDAHDVVAVAVEPGAGARERGLQKGPSVHGEAEVHGGLRLERRRARAALPRFGHQHLERRAPRAGVLRVVLRLEVADVVCGDVHGEVLETLGARGARQAADNGAGRVRDRLAAPLWLHRQAFHAATAAGELTDGGHKLRGAGAVGDGVAEAEADDEAAAREGGNLDEQDKLALILLLGGRGREQLVLGDHHRVLQVLHVLERAGGRGLREPDAAAVAAAVDLQQPTFVREPEASRERVVLHQGLRHSPLDGPRRASVVAAVRSRLEDVQRLDERHLGGVPIKPGQAERADRRGLGRGHQALRQPLDGLVHGRHCNEAARIEWSWWEREVIGGQLAYCYCSLLGFGVWVCCLTYH
ncbi:hypothetical protein CFC21_034464 [Triticum aestivum]|uniref:Uncharacterized protein n=2 Tax=Triticum aestivum TaxID=4565 RepID=A0A3B6EC31_WHEAT|nr:hypothetical protein CFC21_034464 [Triticum aestivum]